MVDNNFEKIINSDILDNFLKSVKAFIEFIYVNKDFNFSNYDLLDSVLIGEATVYSKNIEIKKFFNSFCGFGIDSSWSFADCFISKIKKDGIEYNLLGIADFKDQVVYIFLHKALGKIRSRMVFLGYINTENNNIFTNEIITDKANFLNNINNKNTFKGNLIIDSITSEIKLINKTI